MEPAPGPAPAAEIARNDLLQGNVQVMLDWASGPIFRFAFVLMVLGVLRAIGLALSDTVAGYLTTPDRDEFRRKLRWRILWFVFPCIVVRESGRCPGRGAFIYHAVLCSISLVFRTAAIVLPIFMMEHVYLWERGLGVNWGSIPSKVADVLGVVTLITGLALFLGRLYSPMLRKLEPPWSFLKPLILLLPFASGMLAMHPQWSPFDYHVMMLVHILSAALVMVMIPFGRLMNFLHVRLVSVIPEAEWSNAAAESPERTSVAGGE